MKYHTCFIFLFLFLSASLAKHIDKIQETREFLYDISKCGYSACHPTKSDVLNVHLVPHTHDDVGWLKTVDQYYYGSRTLTQSAGVQYILDSVIDELIKNPNRRFVYVETAFFYKWWLQQSDNKRQLVKKLVLEGRFEFAGGAWSMNDEATTNYQSVLDQMTWGLRFLNDTFGECGRPKTVWQIDPFGHSREMANMWAQSGYDGLFLGRVDFQDKIDRLKNKKAEMIWKGSDNIGKSSDLFTGVLYNNYAPPPGFCFDVLCDDDPIIDDKNSPDYNVDLLVKKFVEYAQKQANSYKTNNIIMTMGEDFFYQDALMSFKNMDKLIKYVNEKEPTLNLIYSTPSCYLKSLHESNKRWPIKEDDFFPYGSDEHSYWTGYFTSRPNIKYFERKGNNILQVCKQLYSLTNVNGNEKKESLNILREAMGVMQHHDAITGTEQQHVAFDYARILNEGIQNCVKRSEEALNNLMYNNGDYHKPQEVKGNYLPMNICQLNITECDITETLSKFVITVYNPLAHVVSEIIRLPVNDKIYSVRTGMGDEINNQVIEISNETKQQLKSIRKSNATNELLFIAENIPPLGYRAYFIEKLKILNKIPFVTHNYQKVLRHPSNFFNKQVVIKALKQNDDFVIGNEKIKIEVAASSGLIKNIIITDNNQSTNIPFKQEILFYNAMDNTTKFRASGAYIFRPNSSEANIIGKPEISVIRSSLVEEIHQRFSNWASQIIRVYKGQSHIEFEWLVGPIPIEDNIGKEIISRFTTNFKTNKIFYTDANGRQMIKRVVDQRPTWNVTLAEPIAGNYYPITSMISIKDSDTSKGMFVLTDRAQGGSLSSDGQIDILIHRRLLFDDHFGVEEPLNETIDGVGLVTKGTHYLLIGDVAKSKVPLAVTSRQLALKKLLQPVTFVSSGNNLTFDSWSKNNNEFSGLHTELAGNVHIVTLEPWKDGDILLRLEHFISSKDDPVDLSKNAMVNLRILFADIKIISYRETSLTANQWIEDVHRLEWETFDNATNNIKVTNGNGRRLSNYKNSIFESLPITAQEKINDYLKLNFPLWTTNITKRILKEDDNDYLVYLKPMEIKTFIIKAVFNE